MTIAATESAHHHRAKPGAKGGGRFFHTELRPAKEFVAFRVQNGGGPAGIERVAGQRANGSWDTAKWLVDKTHAHVEGGRLVGDSAEVRNLLRKLGSVPVHAGGDRFRDQPPRKIPKAKNQRRRCGERNSLISRRRRAAQRRRKARGTRA